MRVKKEMGCEQVSVKFGCMCIQKNGVDQSQENNRKGCFLSGFKDFH
ncbi:hypothetical protein KOY_00072 [Bacillus cereus VDM021]|nr:hypothetical protein IIW_00131 [Bacillus cereus VD136]EOP75201.1 hypothetical protein KOW_02458 [Bacillus cereus VDM006]EOQ14910.1 hypothetical protein KOY_00072 [Bacillus cereus VDM021]